MQLSSETIGRLLASGRNYVGQIIAFGGGVGVMSAAHQKDLSASIVQMVDGIMMVVHGATNAWAIVAVLAAPIIGPILARWASNSARTPNQAAALQAAVKDPNTSVPLEAKAAILDAVANLDEVKKDKPIEVNDPVLAAAVPAENVVAK